MRGPLLAAPLISSDVRILSYVIHYWTMFENSHLHLSDKMNLKSICRFLSLVQFLLCLRIYQSSLVPALRASKFPISKF